MRGIFISYRRDDAEGQAGRLFDDLCARFGKDSVFMDVDSIEPGRDFRKAVDDEISGCAVLLSLIGKRWLESANADGRRRLDDSGDFVRLENAAALKRDIPVIPVLVQGASMPRPDQLPADLEPLAWRNAIELTHARWDSDVDVLTQTLSRYVKSGPARLRSGNAGGEARGAAGQKSRRPIAAALLLAALTAGGLAAYRFWPRSPAGEWYSSDQYQRLFNRNSRRGLYPEKVEGRCADGYEQFRPHWKVLPLGVDFATHHGVTQEFHDGKSRDYAADGYRQSSLTVFTDCSGAERYQATWLKHG